MSATFFYPTFTNVFFYFLHVFTLFIFISTFITSMPVATLKPVRFKMMPKTVSFLVVELCWEAVPDTWPGGTVLGGCSRHVARWNCAGRLFQTRGPVQLCWEAVPDTWPGATVLGGCSRHAARCNCAGRLFQTRGPVQLCWEAVPDTRPGATVLGGCSRHVARRQQSKSNTNYYKSYHHWTLVSLFNVSFFICPTLIYLSHSL